MRELGLLASCTVMLVAAVLQGSLAGHLQVCGLIPDLILLAAVYLGLLSGPTRGAATGFAGGVLQAVLVGASPGSFIVSRAAAGLVIGAVGARLFRENRLVPVTLIFGGTLVGEFAFFLMTPTHGFSHCIRLALGEGLWNALIGLALYPLALRWMNR